MFNRILVPLDGSNLAAKILPQVEELAKCHHSEIALLGVGSVALAETVAEASLRIIEETAAEVKAESEKYLSQTADDLKAKGLKVSWAYVEGIPAREIISYASTNNCDLITMASHGRGEVAWVLGSTTEKVVSHATVPVLVMRVIEFKPPLLKEEFFMGA